MRINCNGCTHCCKYVGAVLANKDRMPEYAKKAIEDFPYKADKNGHCEMLTEDECSVYDDRPDLCNISTMAKRQTERTPAEHFALNEDACSQIKKMNGREE